ncbi:hypothetical protein [Flavobacterium fluviatile]|uniref:hypothetical protein n=1 Tax=Flavobacterium fluviatile TaxID=1862387 RepID=UPI0013D13BBF|nr:hypothetical protein [Flavobacterium fluviatile]
MYLDFLFYLAYFFIFLTFVVFCIRKRAFFAHCWKIAKIKGNNKKQKIDFIKEQEAKGLKPFIFDGGKTTIYAKNGNLAIADYKKMNDDAKRNLRKLKKV